jgi:hypothetical protein
MQKHTQIRYRQKHCNNYDTVIPMNSSFSSYFRTNSNFATAVFENIWRHRRLSPNTSYCDETPETSGKDIFESIREFVEKEKNTFQCTLTNNLKQIQ